MMYFQRPCHVSGTQLELEWWYGTFSYYLSGNFMDQEGLLNYADESYYRYSVNGKINAKINKNISLSYNTKWFRTNYEAPSYLNQLFSTR